jgi:GNAT superfamily N-acetyltransferase
VASSAGSPFEYRIEPLRDSHDRSRFSCGVEALDRYLRTQATQDVRRRVASCFVIVDALGFVGGYYTLSATSIALADLPSALSKKLPRYPSVPSTLMGRLAVDRLHRGKGLGELLLFDAFSKTLRSKIASYAFIVDAKDDVAAAFYERYRFRKLTITGRRMFVPMAEIAALLG